MDRNLVEDAADGVTMFFQILGILFVNIVSFPLFIALLFPLCAVYYRVQKHYLNTSRELQRLESISRSPIFSHFAETINGVKTIKAFGREQRFVRDNLDKIDRNMAAYYCNISANRWLGFRLEFMGIFVVTVAALFAVFSRETLGAAYAGVSILYALQVTNVVNWMVRMMSAVEIDIVSVERILSYCNLPTESSTVAQALPPAIWPKEGSVEFKHVALRYRPGNDPFRWIM